LSKEPSCRVAKSSSAIGTVPVKADIGIVLA
jgi:hypothetical protein